MRAGPIKFKYDGQDAGACSTSTPQAHYEEDCQTARRLGSAGGKARARFAGQLLCPPCPLQLEGHCAAQIATPTRPGGMAVPRTRAGLYELPDCQLVRVKLYFCLHNPAQGSGCSG